MNLLNQKHTHKESFKLADQMAGLPLLNYLTDKFRRDYDEALTLDNIAIIYIHHALDTSVDLLDSVLNLGARPENIFVLGKCYSDCPSVVNKIRNMGIFCLPSSYPDFPGEFSTCFEKDIKTLWSYAYQKVIKNREIKSFIVADHGGYATSSIPKEVTDSFRVIGVEKTAGGINKIGENNKPDIPILDMARCFAKKKFESPLIAEAVANKIPEYINRIDEISKCIVVGHGSIGSSVSKLILKAGGGVTVCDPKKKELIFDEKLKCLDGSLEGCINEFDFVFGCSGCDITEGVNFSKISKNITFVSCSSGDIEFLSLLHFIRNEVGRFTPQKCMEDIVFKTKSGGFLTVLRGGFPVNFDSSGESVPREDIQLTRGLALSAIVQAALLLEKHRFLLPAFYVLDRKLQELVVNKWLTLKKRSRG